MTYDQTAWLNQAREELCQALSRINYATSPRRAGDHDGALACLFRVRDLIVSSGDCVRFAKEGIPYSQRRECEP